MAHDSSMPTQWVAVDLNSRDRREEDGRHRGANVEEVQMDEGPHYENQLFYQHARQYSSFTQTLLRDLPSRTGNVARTLRRRRGSGSEVGYNTLRSYDGTIRGAIDVARFGDDVDAVADAVQEGVVNIPDEFLAREVELNTLRELERPLAYKRQVKQRLEQRDRRRSRRVSLWARLSSSVHYAAVRCRRRLESLAEFLKLWKGHLKQVRGQLGSGVATYFQFLESLFYLNIFSLLLVAGFLLVPQLLLRLTRPSEAFASLHGLPENQTAPSTPYGGNDAFTAGNVFTGQGWLEATELYYGFYYRGRISLFGGLVYRMPLAYFFTITLCLAAQLLLLAIVTARLYRTHFIESSSVIRNVYFNKVLCCWDFSIASDKMAALRHQAVTNELREMTCDAVRRQNRGTEPDTDRPNPFLVRLLVNLLVLGLLVGVGFLTKFLLEQQQKPSATLVTFSLVVTVLVYCLPYLFSGLARLEMYSQLRYQVYITLARTVILELVVLGVTVGFWLDRRSKTEQCWETELGQGIYQLVVMEFLFTLAFSLFAEFGRNQLYRAGLRWLGRPQFDLANSTMFLVYSQTLVWLGLYFSPLLAFISTVKLFIIFYVKKLSALGSCEPAASTWRAAQTRTVFQLVGLVSMMATMAAVGYVVFQVESSPGCGPFQHEGRPWQLVTDLVGSWHSRLLYYLSYVTAPGVVIYIILILIILVYFGRHMYLTQARRVAMLRGQLLLEAQDKRLLLRMIDESARKLRHSHGGESSGRSGEATPDGDSEERTGF